MKKQTFILLSVATLLVLVVFMFSSRGGSVLSSPSESLEQFLTKNEASSEISEAYRFALENPDEVLDKVPCYCGCMETNDHLNNRDCFIEEDGGFDEMGLNCGVCVKTALETKKMHSEGADIIEINKVIDLKFKKT